MTDNDISKLYEDLNKIIPDEELKLSDRISLTYKHSIYCYVLYKLSLLNDDKYKTIIDTSNNRDKIAALVMAIKYNISSLINYTLSSIDNIHKVIEEHNHSLNYYSYKYLFENNIIWNSFDLNKLVKILEWYYMYDDEYMDYFKIFYKHTKINLDLIVPYWSMDYIKFFIEIELPDLRKYKSIISSIYTFVDVFNYFNPSKEQIISDLNDEEVKSLSSDIVPFVIEYIDSKIMYDKHYKYIFMNAYNYKNTIIPNDIYQYIDYSIIDEDVLILMYQQKKYDRDTLISNYLDYHNEISTKLYDHLGLRYSDVKVFWKKLIDKYDIITTRHQLLYLNKFQQSHHIDIVSLLDKNLFSYYLSEYDVKISDIISNDYELIRKLPNLESCHINDIMERYPEIDICNIIDIIDILNDKVKFTDSNLRIITMSSPDQISKLINRCSNDIFLAINNDDIFNELISRKKYNRILLLNICVVTCNVNKMSKITSSMNKKDLTLHLIKHKFNHVSIDSLKHLHHSFLLDLNVIKLHEELLINRFVKDNFELFKYFMIYFDISIMSIREIEYEHAVFLHKTLNYDFNSLKKNINILYSIYSDAKLLKYFNINYFDDDINNIDYVSIECLELITESKNVEKILCEMLFSNFVDEKNIKYIVSNHKINIDILENIITDKRNKHSEFASDADLLILNDIGINRDIVLNFLNHIHIIGGSRYNLNLFNEIYDKFNITFDDIIKNVDEFNELDNYSFKRLITKLKLTNEQLIELFNKYPFQIPLSIVNDTLTKEQSFKCIHKLCDEDIIQYFDSYQITKSELVNNNYEFTKLFPMRLELLTKLHKDLQFDKDDFMNIFDMIIDNVSISMTKYLHGKLKFTTDDFRWNNNSYLIKSVENNHVSCVKYLYNHVGLIIDDFKVNNSYILGVSLEFRSDRMSNFLLNTVGMSLYDLINDRVYTNINGENFYKPLITINNAMLEKIKITNDHEYICDICGYENNDNYKYVMNCCRKNICIECGNRSVGKQAAICAFCRQQIN